MAKTTYTITVDDNKEDNGSDWSPTTKSIVISVIFLFSIYFIGLSINEKGHVYDHLLSYHSEYYNWAEKFIIYYFHYSFGLLSDVTLFFFNWLKEMEPTQFKNLNSILRFIIGSVFILFFIFIVEKLKMRFSNFIREFIAITIIFPCFIFIVLEGIIWLFS